MDRVTPRELEVLRLIATGNSTKQVAFQLGIAFKTAASHRYRLIEKLDAANTADLVCRAAQRGLIDVFGLRSTEGDSIPMNVLAHRILANRSEASQSRQALAAAVSRSTEIRKRHQEILEQLTVARERTMIFVEALRDGLRDPAVRRKSDRD